MRYRHLDRRIKIISIEEWYKDSDYFKNVNFNLLYDEKNSERWWHDGCHPSLGKAYYISEKYLITLIYKKTDNFHISKEVLLENILIAKRDGKTEYKILEEQIENFSYDSDAKSLKYVLNNLIPNFLDNFVKKPNINFEDNIITTVRDNLNPKASDYVVFDVETNGLSYGRDDLLSFSIYDPMAGIIYERYLPLEIQPLVLTGYINGIKTKDLNKFESLTQEEIDYIFDKFNLENRKILIYCGKNKLFDADFLFQYMKRHGLNKFERLNFYNFRNSLNDGEICKFTYLSKDNLCNLFNIEGVSNVHTASNDVLLEWKLFNKIIDKYYLFINDSLYEFNSDSKYILPLEEAKKSESLRQIKNIELLNSDQKPTSFRLDDENNVVIDYQKISIKMNEIYNEKFKLGNKELTEIEYIVKPKNIELLLRKMLNINYLNTEEFLENNINKLTKIATLPKEISNKNSRFSNTLNYKNTNDNLINNAVSLEKNPLVPKLEKTIKFIQNEIFQNEEINKNEIVISDDNKIFDVCDLSNKNTVLNLDTDEISFDKYSFVNLTERMYFQKKKRKYYIASIETYYSGISYVNLNIRLLIYKVDFINHDN